MVPPVLYTNIGLRRPLSVHSAPPRVAVDEEYVPSTKEGRSVRGLPAGLSFAQSALTCYHHAREPEMVNYIQLYRIRRIVKKILKDKIADDEIATTPKSCIGCLADDISWEIYYLLKEKEPPDAPPTA
jgi:hypothetical protein